MSSESDNYANNDEMDNQATSYQKYFYLFLFINIFFRWQLHLQPRNA